jgi:hypothetical protein
VTVVAEEPCHAVDGDVIVVDDQEAGHVRTCPCNAQAR